MVRKEEGLEGEEAMAALLIRTVFEFQLRCCCPRVIVEGGDVPSSLPWFVLILSKQAVMLSSLVTSSCTGSKVALRCRSLEIASSAADRSLDATRTKQSSSFSAIP